MSGLFKFGIKVDGWDCGCHGHILGKIMCQKKFVECTLPVTLNVKLSAGLGMQHQLKRDWRYLRVGCHGGEDMQNLDQQWQNLITNFALN